MPRPPLPIGTHGKIKITKKPAGGYLARAKYRDPDGVTRPVERVGRTETLARNNLLEALQDRSTTATGATLTGDSRLSAAAALWIAAIDAAAETGDLALNTARLYRLQLDNHVLPALGALRLREVATPRADACLLSIRKNAGVATAKTCRTVVSAVMGLAVRHGAVTVNPAREVSRITARPKRAPRALTADERDQWIGQLEADKRAVKKDLPDLTRWMLATGVRMGEALAVGWDDIDVADALVRVEWNLIRVTGQGLLRVPRMKSVAGERELPLPPFAVAMLKRRAETCGDVLPLFPNSRGGWRDPSNTSRDLRNARGTEGFAWVRSHVFRKTHATILDEAGLSARVVADQLGHARPSMTQDVYMGRKTVNRAAADAIEAANR